MDFLIFMVIFQTVLHLIDLLYAEFKLTLINSFKIKYKILYKIFGCSLKKENFLKVIFETFYQFILETKNTLQKKII